MDVGDALAAGEGLDAVGDFPWYYGRTVGEKYGWNKRLLLAVLKGREDRRWAGFIQMALDGRIPPCYRDTYIRPFVGTEEQKRVLLDLIDAINGV